HQRRRDDDDVLAGALGLVLIDRERELRERLLDGARHGDEFTVVGVRMIGERARRERHVRFGGRARRRGRRRGALAALPSTASLPPLLLRLRRRGRLLLLGRDRGDEKRRRERHRRAVLRAFEEGHG